MNSMTKLPLAAAAALLFATSVVPAVQAADGASTSVKCSGINACKGQSKCATADSACAGQNSCKGHGWIKSASAEECEAAGGTVLK